MEDRRLDKKGPISLVRCFWQECWHTGLQNAIAKTRWVMKGRPGEIWVNPHQNPHHVPAVPHPVQNPPSGNTPQPPPAEAAASPRPQPAETAPAPAPPPAPKPTPSPFPPVPSNSFSYLPLLSRRPLISIVMPVYNSKWLQEAVDSVLNQTYENFELVLVDDESTVVETRAVLKYMERQDKVRVIRNPENLGISGATNRGIKAAKGEYIGFMDHDDLIHPDALALFVRTLNGTSDADVFYTDEAIMTESGYVHTHMRKCQVSMDLLLSCNSVLHFCLMKRESLLRVGLLRSECDGSQDHDLMIRALEAGLEFCHLPYILYAWRVHSQSTSNETRGTLPTDTGKVPKTYRNGCRAIQDYLDRNNIRATLATDIFPWYRVRYELPSTEETVAVIIPFKDKPELLRTLLNSWEMTTYKNVVFYLVNNQSKDLKTLTYMEVLNERDDVHIVNFDEPYNFSRIYNTVVETVPHEILLFLNNDIEIKQPDWMEAMLEHIYRPNVAAVGCKLLRGDGSIQHAGTFFRPTVFSCAQNFHFAYSYYTESQRDVTGVTAACMMVRKSAFQAVGGFDEIHFPIGFSDADLCLRFIEGGYKIMYTPFAELLHHESVSRKVNEESYEIYTLFQRHIGETKMHDAHYDTVFST